MLGYNFPLVYDVLGNYEYNYESSFCIYLETIFTALDRKDTEFILNLLLGKLIEIGLNKICISRY